DCRHGRRARGDRVAAPRGGCGVGGASGCRRAGAVGRSGRLCTGADLPRRAAVLDRGLYLLWRRGAVVDVAALLDGVWETCVGAPRGRRCPVIPGDSRSPLRPARDRIAHGTVIGGGPGGLAL